MNRYYETLFVVKPTLSDEEIKGQIDNIKSILEQNGGQIAATDDMGMRKLAYEIEKNQRGYYYVIYFTAPGELIGELERNYRINESIIRYLNVKFENKKEIAAWQGLVDKASKAEQKADTKEPAPENA